MLVQEIEIKNFRCFDHIKLTFDASVIFIEGANGVGKTSILEALHYLCYLRSFRTSTTKDMIQDNAAGFFIKVCLREHDQYSDHELTVGFSPKKRIIKFDNQVIGSFKELIPLFRVVSLIEDDLALIKGGPEYRRAFLDQALFLHDPGIIELFKKFKKIVEQRNILFKSRNCSQEMYDLWTEQLFDISMVVAHRRREYLTILTKEVDALARQYEFNEIAIEMEYKSKLGDLSLTYDGFSHLNPGLYDSEMRMGRSLFGAHLDDFTIIYNKRGSRYFASRGQQKLTIILMKVAQIKILGQTKGPTLFLLDDFMTDLDASRLDFLYKLLQTLDLQAIFTFPYNQSPFKDELFSRSNTHKKLTI